MRASPRPPRARSFAASVASTAAASVARSGAGVRRPTRMIEAENWSSKPRKSLGDFQIGDRVFHDKFGYGRVEAIDDSKLEIAFDKAGRKKVLDSFVQPA